MPEDIAWDETAVPEDAQLAGALSPDLLGATLADETLVADPAEGVDVGATGPGAALRNTVLPRLRVMEGAPPKLEHAGAERYQPVRPLGEGALGDVMLVRDNDIRREVAMKKLKPERHQPASVHRFVEEIQMVGALDHPNIVPVHDVGVDPDGQYYFIMKYVEGQTLEDVIELLSQGDPETVAAFPVEVRVHLFLDILRAVRCAHQDGIIHRDLKPANIMVGRFGEAMVMDWGLAKRIREPSPLADALFEEAVPEQGEDAIRATGRFQTQAGTLMGTPAYMSPEQARGETEAIDERSDIYALTVLFHELITLRHYLRDKTTLNAVLMAICSDEPAIRVSKEAGEAEVPAELMWFAKRGLEKDPAERFQSIAEMELTLRGILSGKMDVQCPVTFMRRSSHEWLHFINRNPGLSMLLIGVVASLTLFGVVSAVLMVAG